MLAIKKGQPQPSLISHPATPRYGFKPLSLRN